MNDLLSILYNWLSPPPPLFFWYIRCKRKHYVMHQQSRMVKSTGSGGRVPGFKSPLWYVLAVWPWASASTSLWFDFLFSKVGNTNNNLSLKRIEWVMHVKSLEKFLELVGTMLVVVVASVINKWKTSSHWLHRQREKENTNTIYIYIYVCFIYIYIFTQWNTTQPLKRMKFCHLRQQG